MSENRFELRVAVYLILLRGNDILLLRRFKTGWGDGNYSLVFGHLDGGETVSQAMIREASEEARITVDKDDLVPAVVIHRMSNVEYVDFFFVAKKWKGEPEIGEPDKCNDLSWFPLDNLPNNLLPHVKEALEKYKNKVPFFESGWN